MKVTMKTRLDLHCYVPVSTISGEYIGDNNKIQKTSVDKFHYILFGGDQLTAISSTAFGSGCTHPHQ